MLQTTGSQSPKTDTVIWDCVTFILWLFFVYDQEPGVSKTMFICSWINNIDFHTASSSDGCSVMSTRATISFLWHRLCFFKALCTKQTTRPQPQCLLISADRRETSQCYRFLTWKTVSSKIHFKCTILK